MTSVRAGALESAELAAVTDRRFRRLDEDPGPTHEIRSLNVGELTG